MSILVYIEDGKLFTNSEEGEKGKKYYEMYNLKDLLHTLRKKQNIYSYRLKSPESKDSDSIRKIENKNVLSP